MKDSRYAALAKSLFDPNCAYGVLAVRRSKYADEFIENFITSDEVQQETISFITKISTLFTSAGEEPKLILSPNIISAQEVESLPSPETAKANGVVPKILTSNGYQGLGDYKVRPLELPEMQKQKIAVTSPSIDATAPVAAPESCISPRSASPDVSVLVAEAPVAAVQSTLNASTAEGKAPASPGATATAPPPAPTGTADDQVESPKKPDASSLPVRAPVSSLGPHAAPTVQRKVPPEGRKSTFSVSTNGKVNTPFSGKIEGKNENGMPVVICGVELPEDLGLKFDCERGELVGTPLKSGEFKGRILYKFQGSSTIDPVLEGECSVVINHDPKTLWKSEQSDQNDPYWKKDEDQALFSGNDGLSMVAASKRGRSHAHVGSFRDDDFCIAEEVGSGWRVLTVADGAGSAKKSRKGSLLASRAATNHVLKVLVEEKGMLLDKALDLWETDRTEAGKEIQAQLYYLFGNAAKSAVQAIETEATATGCAYKDFSTTLVMTIHKKVPVGHFIAAYWVGDGGVGVYRHGAEIKVLGKADCGEFAGQTRFLDSAMLESQEIMGRIRITIVPDFTALMVMTDGITDAWFETDANFERREKWELLWTELQPVVEAADPAAALLDWLDFWSPGNHDDRTIALLYSQQSSITEETTT